MPHPLARLVLASLTLAASAPAQNAATPGPGAEPKPAPAAAPQPAKPARLEDYPPAIRLGIRAEAVRRGWPAIPDVVIVPDEASYAKAIAAWTLRGRFPVLIDDGSDRAREDIARFVRAFGPRRVVRWSAAGATWPAAAAERQGMIEAALLAAWSGGLPNETSPPKIAIQKDLIARWVQIGSPPPGIIAADAGDPAWPAALALAAGRCEPIAWVHTGSNINATLSPEEAEALELAIEAACQEAGLPWRDRGDALDALTLCLNCPAKIQADRETIIATTDLMGRLPGVVNKDAPVPPPAGGPRVRGERWAWSGQIFGSPPQAAYRAMCALFIEPAKAWLFDGYQDTQPWSLFDATAAADPLKKFGMETMVDDTPRQSDHTWRMRAARTVDAGLITVNTHGNADEFNLEPGRCRPGDIPFLDVPAIVYFVHSWSAAVPGERGTVAGRWLERGAYAYLGSTQEPYLKAFVPTPAFTARMASGFPWAAAVRYDDRTDAWKLATFGDPLITLGPPPTRSDAALPLEGATDLEDTLRTLQGRLREKRTAEDLAQTILTLTLLGRDSVAAQLAAAVAGENTRNFTPAVAEASILPLLRAHDTDTIVKAFGVLPAGRADGPRRDALWHACYTSLGGSRNEAMLAALRTNLRPDQVGRDAADLSRAVAQVSGRDAATAMLTDAKARSTTDDDRWKVDEAMKALDLIGQRKKK